MNVGEEVLELEALISKFVGDPSDLTNFKKLVSIKYDFNNFEIYIFEDGVYHIYILVGPQQYQVNRISIEYLVESIVLNGKFQDFITYIKLELLNSIY